MVIPTLNEADNVARAIAAARRSYGRDQVEIVVVDGGSRDGTTDLIPPTERCITSEPGRATQMNRGASAARGEILLFCHADTRLPPGWREAVVEALEQLGVSGGSFDIRVEPAVGILHVLNALRYPADWRLMYGDQAQFTTRTIFDSVGGFPEMPLMEDLELMRKLDQRGRVVRIPLQVTSSSRRFLERGPIRQLWLDLSLVIRYLYLGVDVDELAREYYGTPGHGGPP